MLGDPRPAAMVEACVSTGRHWVPAMCYHIIRETSAHHCVQF